MSDDSNPLMMIVWILPIILFVFYGQHIQLLVTSSQLKKGIKKLDGFRNESRTELINYLKHNLNAHAIASLKQELVSVEGDISALIKDMETSIKEADSFISKMGF